MNLARLKHDTFEMFRAPKRQTVSEWADENRMLVSESSSEPGRWRTDRAPYQREIMDAFTQAGIWKIVIMASAQVGKTEIEMNMMGRAIDVDPGPIMFIQPTDGFAEDFSKQRIAPMIKACPNLLRKVYDAKSRDSGNTIQTKTFPGGTIKITGANSPTELAGRPIRYLFMDEIDRFPTSAGTEGNPLELAERRTETFRHNRKIVETSTPTLKNISRIEKDFILGTQEEWHTECPCCHRFSYIRFEHIIYDKTEYNANGEKGYKVTNAKWKCPFCATMTSEIDTKRQPAKWVMMNAEAMESGIRSFRLNAFMSPWSDWKDIIHKYLIAKDEPELLKVFFNTMLGETWEFVADRGVPEELFNRREKYNAEVPNEALVLTMGVDTQDNRLMYEVVGWSADEESWGIEYGTLSGRADSDGVWEQLDSLLEKEWIREDGNAMRISATFIDSGGHYTSEIYKQCRARRTKRLWAIKGEGGDGKQYVRQMNKSTADLILFMIGVDCGKEAIMYASAIKDYGAKYMHYTNDPSRGYDIDYFRGLISEKQVLKRRMGQTVVQWEKYFERNEPLDCRNYARAAYKFFKWNFDAIKQKLKGNDAPKTETRQSYEHRKPKRQISAGIKI